MNRMTALAELLDDADELLDQADEQTITEALERGEAPDFDIRRQFEPCPWCGHGFHGIDCAPPVDFLEATLQFVPDDEAIDDASLPLEHPHAASWRCYCESALEPLDDTWRPLWSGDADEKRRHDIAWHMRKTGLDGWSAAAELDHRRRARQVAFVEFVEKVGETVRPALVSFGEAMGAIGAGMAHLVVPTVRFPRTVHVDVQLDPMTLQRLTELYRVDDDAPTEETTADRALRLRQTRNTGPDRPTANRARRPRRHGG